MSARPRNLRSYDEGSDDEGSEAQCRAPVWLTSAAWPLLVTCWSGGPFALPLEKHQKGQCEDKDPTQRHKSDIK